MVIPSKRGGDGRLEGAKFVFRGVPRGKRTAQARPAGGESFAEVCRQYLERYARPRKKSWREDERRIGKLLVPQLGHRPAPEIRRSDVRAVLDPIVDRGAGIEANRTHALIRKIFNWAISMDLVERNPCTHLPRPARERMRFHVLGKDELRRFWTALEEETPRIRSTFRLMLLTAQRGGEVVGMRWEEIELSTGWWTIPAELAKNGLPHRVPLSPAALQIVLGVRAHAPDSPWVFPSFRTSGHWAGLQKAIQRVRRRAGIELRGHDLRRTAASCMASMGASRLSIARILNHVETGVTAVYDRYSYDREKREALEAWARRLQEIIGVTPEQDASRETGPPRPPWSTRILLPGRRDAR
jgi:integrase